MTVENLIETLKKFDKNAVVFINGLVVSGVEKHTGRYNAVDYDGRDSSGNVRFRKTQNGKQTGITFTHYTESSDGDLYPSEHWT